MLVEQEVPKMAVRAMNFKMEEKDITDYRKMSGLK